MYLGTARLAFVKKAHEMGLICEEGPTQVQKVQDILDLLFEDGNSDSLLDKLTTSRFNTEWNSSIEYDVAECSYFYCPAYQCGGQAISMCTGGGIAKYQMKDNYQYGKLIHDCSQKCVRDYSRCTTR